MHVLICSPLYPPDIESTALHVKELAQRLSAKHSVTVLTYGSYPEHIDGVTIQAIPKDLPLLQRMTRYTIALFRISSTADCIYTENGASVELPILLVALIRRKKILFHMGDTRSTQAARTHLFRGALQKFVALLSCDVIHTSPPARPEIIPFLPLPVQEFEIYNTSWDEYITLCESRCV